MKTPAPGGTGFLFTHGEKFAAGAAGALLAGFCAWAYGMPHDREAAVAVGEFDHSIRPDSRKYQAEHAQARARLTAADAADAWRSLASARPVGPWTSAYKTAVTITKKSVAMRIDTQRTWILPTAQLGEPIVDHTGVRIDVTVTPPKLAPPQRDATGAITAEELEAEVTGWEVQRCVCDAGGKQGPWNALKADPVAIGEQKLWLLKDTQVAPKTRYAYRLKPVGRATLNIGPVLYAEFCAPREARTVGDFRWTINSVLTPPEGRAQIGIFVTKYERSLGREILGKLTHVEGDRIGVTVLDDQAVSVHPAWDPAKPGLAIKDASGRQARVDFNTGARIAKFETLDLEIPCTSCKIEFAPDGTKACKGEETRTEVFKGAGHVVIVDDDGTPQHWWNAGRWSNEKPTRNGKRCAGHAAR